jgi:predicted nucleic acid-binding protein
VVYLDTGCFLKLYYPEPNSSLVASAVAGRVIAFTALHELETTTALQLKLFRAEATPEQADAAMRLVREDLASGKLAQPPVNWPAVLHNAAELARAHAAKSGCRSLDVLHCAVALAMNAEGFVSSDARQIAVATAMGLAVVPV